MKTNRKGLAPVAIVLLVALGVIIIVGGAYYWHSQMTAVSVQQPSAPTSTTPTSTPTSTIPLTPTSTTSTPTSTPAKASLSPTSGAVGSTVTIHGSGFAKTGNVVTMNGLTTGEMKSVASADGKTLTFTVPSELGPVCRSEMCAQFLVEVMSHSAYTVAVESADGKTSQTIGSFTVTSGGKLPM